MIKMEQNSIIRACKDLGCCDACCLRYLGLKNPAAYENPREFVNKYLQPEKDSTNDSKNSQTDHKVSETEEVPAKKQKTEDVCVSCIGVLQEDSWPPCLDMLKETLEKKKYECETFACALSAPISTMLREKAIVMHLAGTLAHYNSDGAVTPLKEAWKWAMGGAMEQCCKKTLDSGAVAPLLITLHLDYPQEAKELDALAPLSSERARGSLTRRQAERALENAKPDALRSVGLLPPSRPEARVRPVSVASAHAPLYLGGRYIKLSRTLPQTPWVLRGERIMESSVQEIIFAPIAKLFSMEEADVEHRLKFMSAGREDVDVRCLGNGRPFAVEIADPSRTPSPEELKNVCEEISSSNLVLVHALCPISREKLTELKRGEESKRKTYEALCIKLNGDVTEEELKRVSTWSGSLEQRTPLRVLHRRPLLARGRRLEAVSATAVPAHPRLLVLRLHTDAGTYVKEWAHGDLRRTRPSLADALGSPADILALDVTEVHLEWP